MKLYSRNILLKDQISLNLKLKKQVEDKELEIKEMAIIRDAETHCFQNNEQKLNMNLKEKDQQINLLKEELEKTLNKNATPTEDK